MNTLTFTPGAMLAAINAIADHALERAEQYPVSAQQYLEEASNSLRGLLIVLRFADGSGLPYAEKCIKEALGDLSAAALSMRIKQKVSQYRTVPQTSFCGAGV